MSRLDIARSFLRSAASATILSIGKLHLNDAVRAAIDTLLRHRLLLPDGRLTAAIARVPNVTEATVSTRDGQMRVDASFRDGGRLLVHLSPLHTAFAPRGAKEWSVAVKPESAALDPRCADIVVALSAEVAKTLWGPFLRRGRSRPRQRGVVTSTAHREGAVLVVDLRSVAEVRAALGQPLLAAAIDALSLRSVVAENGGLRLTAGL